MMNRNVVIKMIMWGLVLSLALLCAAGCASPADPVVKIGRDEVPSLYTVAGEKKINGTSSRTANGNAEKELTYWQGVVSNDEARGYAEALEQQGYTMMTKSESDERPMYQVARNSVQDGKLLYVTIEFSRDGECIITYKLTDGSI